MKNIFWKILGIINVLAIAGGILAFTSLNPGNKKIAYVDNSHLFNEFKLKKELEKDISRAMTARKSLLDSMRLALERTRQKLESDKVPDKNGIRDFETAKQQYLLKEEQMQEQNKAMARKGDEQVWKQLNEYVRDYGKEHGYDLLLGTSGDGNLMYGSEGCDVTPDLIRYTNTRYTGK